MRVGDAAPAEVWLHRGSPALAARCARLLSSKEQAAVATRRQPLDQARSTAGRSLLKILLAEEFGIDPASVELLAPAGRGGKPELCWVAGPGGPPGLSANISHAGGEVVAAVARGASVGVDVEEHAATAFAGFDDIALSPAERAAVALLPARLRPRARTEFWVRKEAVLKALGVGLRGNPAEHCFAGAGRQFALADTRGQPGSGFTVQLLRTSPGHSAAVGVAGCTALSCHELPLAEAVINNYETKT